MKIWRATESYQFRCFNANYFLSRSQRDTQKPSSFHDNFIAGFHRHLFSCLFFFPSHLIFSFPYYFALLSHSPPSFLDIFLKPPPHCVPFFLSRRLPALTKKTPFQFLKGYNNCRNADRVTLPPGVEQWIIRHCFLYKPSYRERG